MPYLVHGKGMEDRHGATQSCGRSAVAGMVACRHCGQKSGLSERLKRATRTQRFGSILKPTQSSR